MSYVDQGSAVSRGGWRIQPLLILSMSLLVMLSIGLLTAIEAVREQERYREEILERASLMAKVVSQTMADPLYFGNVERIRHLAETVSSMPEVRGYRIFNKDGRILVDSEATKFSAGLVGEGTLDAARGPQTITSRSDEEYQIVAQIRVGRDVLGGLAISVDTTSIAPHVRLIIRERLRFGGIAVVMGIIAAVLLGRWLTTPIRQLITAARRVASGDLSFSIGGERGDEIGDLSVAFEKMVRGLEKQAEAKAEQHTAELERANELLRQHATQDALTGLPNRRLLLDRFGVAKAKAKRESGQLALFFLDLDEFKVVNDLLGHAVGDEVLVELGERLTKVVREEDTVARLGGDEFVLLIYGFADRREIGVVARKILAYVSEPVTAEGERFDLTASLGISLYPDDADSLDELLRKADGAMYRAKELGKNRFEFFAKGMERAG